MAIPILGPLLSLVTTGVEKFAENRKLKMEQKTAKEMAKIKRLQKLDDADSDWDKIMAEASDTSWKDEFWTIVLSIPAILAFIPSLADDVLRGFEVLSAMPEWYKAAVGIAIAAAFGFRKFSNIMSKK